MMELLLVITHCDAQMDVISNVPHVAMTIVRLRLDVVYINKSMIATITHGRTTPYARNAIINYV
jgi:uncharacterized membrane protein (UPF0127 family)